MKVSIITACYNNADTIEDTLLSVVGQDYQDIEYIIVDGSSTDATLSIVERFRDKIAYVETGRDGGIYFALNKGLSFATGDLIAFLHADDVYAHPQVISRVVKQLQQTNADSLYGDLNYVNRHDLKQVVRRWESGDYFRENFKKGWMPPHPAFFLKRQCYTQFGGFNTSLRSAADYELMLRMLYRYRVSTIYLSEVLVLMRTGGTSNASLRNRIRANREDRRAWKINGLKPGMFTLIRKPLSKLKQFLIR